MRTRTSSRPALEYQRMQVETASPAQLIVMLYDGALRFATFAKERMASGDLEARHTYLMKAQRIVTELLAILDMENGGAVAQNLRSLYAYILKQLVEANLYDDAARIDEALGMLRELREAWAQVADHGIPPNQAPSAPRKVAIGG
ncbi:MAG: flagellar export chaperone FliS [Chthonomonadales bacterium]